VSRVVAWFSCGAASACASKLTLDKYPEAEVVYCNTIANEHPDNHRFMYEVEQWLGKAVTVVSSKRYANVEEVFAARRYMSGIAGAPCTVELKKIPRFDFQQADDVHVFGFTKDEEKRIARFEMNNPELNLEWVLRNAGVTKENCFQMLRDAGIELPIMYQLGYKNNNCIGCVKASGVKYWAKIRKDFPETFKRRCEQSREIGAKLVKHKGERIFLDELPEGDFKRGKLEDISCGPECGGERMPDNYE
jgi:hypothetical protein